METILMGGAGAVGADGTIIMLAGLARKKPHLLIVEDSFISAAHLHEVVEEALSAESLPATKVSVAMGIITHNIALAFLARQDLSRRTKARANNMPTVFGSGNKSTSLSDDLNDAPLLSKPVEQPDWCASPKL